MHSRLVAGVDHPLAVQPAGGHRLLGHDVPAGRGHLHRLLGMDPARRGQDHDVGRGARQHGLEGAEPRDTGALLGPGERLRVDVAHPDELGSLRMRGQRVEVVGGNPAAAREGESDSPVRDERLGDEHGSGAEGPKAGQNVTGMEVTGYREAAGAPRRQPIWRNEGQTAIL